MSHHFIKESFYKDKVRKYWIKVAKKLKVCKIGEKKAKIFATKYYM